MEDRPPVNITSPGPVPLNLQIGKMRIVRDESGTFQLQPDTSDTVQAKSSSESICHAVQKRERDREVLSLQLVMQQLKMDNEVLRKQLTSSEKTSETSKYGNYFLFCDLV